MARSAPNLHLNGTLINEDHPFPIILGSDAQEGALVSIPVTLGAGVTTVELPDWAQGFVLSPVTSPVRFAINEDPEAEAANSNSTIVAADFFTGATARADTDTVRLLAAGTGRTLHLLGTNLATCEVEIF